MDGWTDPKKYSRPYATTLLPVDPVDFDVFFM